MKATVDNHGPEKSVKQIKAKLGRLKDAYKQVKDNNGRTGQKQPPEVFCEERCS